MMGVLEEGEQPLGKKGMFDDTPYSSLPIRWIKR